MPILTDWRYQLYYRDLFLKLHASTSCIVFVSSFYCNQTDNVWNFVFSLCLISSWIIDFKFAEQIWDTLVYILANLGFNCMKDWGLGLELVKYFCPLQIVLAQKPKIWELIHSQNLSEMCLDSFLCHDFPSMQIILWQTEAKVLKLSQLVYTTESFVRYCLGHYIIWLGCNVWWFIENLKVKTVLFLMKKVKSF